MFCSNTLPILLFLTVFFTFFRTGSAQEVEIQSSGQIKNLKDPVDLQDVATKAYFDQQLMKLGNALLEAGVCPLDLIKAGIRKDSLYGRMYQGGMIFYLDDQDTIAGLKGLVAAPANWDGMNNPDPFVQWGCKGVTTGAVGFEIGSGMQNTSDILQNCETAGIGAVLSDKLDLNGYSDWFLPSWYELSEMYQEIGPGAVGSNQNIGGFTNGTYWSSTEYSSNWASTQDFDENGLLSAWDKNENQGVRPIRQF